MRSVGVIKPFYYCHGCSFSNELGMISSRPPEINKLYTGRSSESCLTNGITHSLISFKNEEGNGCSYLKTQEYFSECLVRLNSFPPEIVNFKLEATPNYPLSVMCSIKTQKKLVPRVNFQSEKPIPWNTPKKYLQKTRN